MIQSYMKVETVSKQAHKDQSCKSIKREENNQHDTLCTMVAKETKVLPAYPRTAVPGE